MLKGIKKSINPNNQSQNIKLDDNKMKAQNEINDQQIKLFSSNQNSIKQKFIIEEQEISNQLQNQNNKINQQQFQQTNNKTYQKLRQKAVQIFNIYKSGDIFKLQDQLQLFDKLQANYLSQQSKSRQKSNNSFKNQNNPNISQLNQQVKPKGKFQYNFNYQSDEQEQNKKSKKRSHKSRPIMRSQKIQDYCIYCPDNQQIRLISASNYVYLALPKRKTFHKYWHFILAPVQHQQTTIGLNQDVLTQLSNYKKCLLQLFDKKNYLVVFWQQFSQENSHIYIQCLAIPFAKGQDFPFYFKQSLQTVQGNWTTHNSIIKIEKQKGGLQKQIPKKIKYFYIDFSLGFGYAHVIQDDKFWKRDFCNDIIATALGIQLYQVKTASQFSDDQLNKKEQQFKKMWQPYDWTKCL